MSTGPDEIDLSDPTNLCGWVDHPERHGVAAMFPAFQAAAPLCMASVDADDKSPVLLYKAVLDVLGSWDKLPWVPQRIGDCTSFGWGHSLDILQCVELVLGTDSGDFAETCTEAFYAAGREAGNMLRPHAGGMGDGCYGSAMAKASTTLGFVPRFMVPESVGGPAYSGDRAASWGWRGMPDAVRKIAAGFKLGAAALVSTWDELVASIRNGYPVAICSSWGGTYQRDENGFIQQGWRPWPHCMLLCGVRFDVEGAACMNSWPLGMFTGPTGLDLWKGGYWLRRRDVEKILSGRDSFSLAKAPDFKPRPLPAKWTYAAAA